jgi:hypothetical protein
MIEGEEDRIQPVRIEHLIDEVWNDGQLEQYYNFLVYQFERDGAYCHARSYADDFRDVTVYGPFEGQHSIEKVSRPDFENDVVRYLQRRFLNVTPF